MLNFKVQQQNLFDQVSERGIPLYGTIPTNGVIFSDSDLSSTGASLINFGNRIIKSVAPANAGTLVNFSPPSTPLTSSTSGSHSFSGSDPAYLAAASWAGGSGSWNQFTTAAGNHNHTINNIFFNWSDIIRTNYGGFSLAGSRVIPTNGIVFNASRPNITYTDANLNTNHFGGAATTGDINTSTGGAAVQTLIFGVTNASGHNHGPNSPTLVSTGSLNGTNTSDTTSGGHSHTVSVTMRWTINNKASLYAWRSNSDASPITRGTIIGWNSTSTSLPTGWFFCDGGTYNGFTTVNFNQGLHLIAQLSSSGLHGTTSTGTDTFTNDAIVNSSTLTTTYNSGSHVHTPYTASATKNLGSPTGSLAQWYHSSWNIGWTHTHTWGTASYTGGPSSYGLPLIIYLP